MLPTSPASPASPRSPKSLSFFSGASSGSTGESESPPSEDGGCGRAPAVLSSLSLVALRNKARRILDVPSISEHGDAESDAAALADAAAGGGGGSGMGLGLGFWRDKHRRQDAMEAKLAHQAQLLTSPIKVKQPRGGDSSHEETKGAPSSPKSKRRRPPPAVPRYAQQRGLTFDQFAMSRSNTGGGGGGGPSSSPQLHGRDDDAGKHSKPGYKSRNAARLRALGETAGDESTTASGALRREKLGDSLARSPASSPTQDVEATAGRASPTHDVEATAGRASPTQSSSSPPLLSAQTAQVPKKGGSPGSGPSSLVLDWLPQRRPPTVWGSFSSGGGSGSGSVDSGGGDSSPPPLPRTAQAAVDDDAAPSVLSSAFKSVEASQAAGAAKRAAIVASLARVEAIRNARAEAGAAKRGGSLEPPGATAAAAAAAAATTASAAAATAGYPRGSTIAARRSARGANSASAAVAGFRPAPQPVPRTASAGGVLPLRSASVQPTGHTAREVLGSPDKRTAISESRAKVEAIRNARIKANADFYSRLGNVGTSI